MPDIVITPNRGTTSNPKIDFTGTSAGTIKLEVLSDGTIAWNGANGSLFSIADSLSGSLMSVNDISGLPAFEVFSDNRVIVGQFGAKLGIGITNPSYKLDVSGTARISGATIFSSATTFNGGNGSQVNGNGSTLSLTVNGNWNSGVGSLIQLTTSDLNFWSNGGIYYFKNSAGGNAATINSTNGNIETTGGFAANRDGDSGNLVNGVSLWSSSNATTSISYFKRWSAIFGRANTLLTEATGYATYHLMDTAGRGWVWRYISSNNTSTGTNVASLRNDTGQMSLGTSWDWSGGYHAQLNIAAGQGSATTYRDIDLHGSWSAGEGHAITATYSTGANNIVGQIVFQYDSPNARIRFGKLHYNGDTSSYPLDLIATSATAANLVLNNGNMGIGTSSPVATLDVRGGIAVSGWSNNNGGTAGGVEFGWDGTQALMQSYNRVGSAYTPVALCGSVVKFYISGTEKIRIDGNGNLGIGTSSPAYKLEVIGDAKFGSGACNLYMVGDQTWRWIAGTSGYGVGSGFGLYHDTGGAYRLAIDTNGNVGIATTGPSYKLHVSGDIYANGGWFRVSGTQGYYFQDYGGGWFMNDSTWIRAYNDKAIITNNEIRATIFKDANDTAYYADPASTSVLSKLSVGNAPYVASIQAGALELGRTDTNYQYISGWTGTMQGGILANCADNWEFVIHDSGHRLASAFEFRGSGTNVIRLGRDLGWGVTPIETPGNLTVIGNAYAPVFYDYNDTNFRLDPASTTTSLQIAGAIEQGNNFAHPNVEWAQSGSATGMVIIKFPGNTGNYGMIHAVVDIYEYSSNSACTVTVAGHNWNGAWYNISSEVIGYTDKQVRVGVKDSQYCIVIGTSGSSWSYGQVRLRKIQNGSYYNDQMDLGGAYSATITTTESFSNISGDLRNLRTPNNISVGGGIYGQIFYDSNNTGYYADPASTSDSALRIRGGTLYGPNTTWGAYLMVGGDGRQNYTDNTSTASVTTTNGNLHLDSASGFNSYINWYDGNDLIVGAGNSSNERLRVYGSSNYTEVTGSMRAPLFYDRDDTNYYVDGNNGTALKYLRVNGDWGGSPFGSGHETFTVTGTYASICQRQTNGAQAYVLHHVSDSYYLYIGRGSTNGSDWNWALRAMPNQDGSYVIFNTSARAPIFYDSNNTGYYCDPASVSNLYSIQSVYLNGNYTNTSAYNSSNGLLSTPTGIRSQASFITFTDGNAIAPYALYRTSGDWPAPYGIGWGTGGESSGIFQRYASNGFSFGDMIFYVNNDGSGAFRWVTGTWEGTAYNGAGSNHYGNTAMSLDWSGNLQANGSVRGPIFYDSNDTNYYVDPANGGFSLRGGTSNRVTFSTTDNGIFVANAEGGGTTVRLGAAWGCPGVYNNTSLTLGAESNIEFRIASAQKGYIDSSSNLFAFGSMRSPYFYDYNDTNYYLKPNGTSYLWRPSAATQQRWGISWRAVDAGAQRTGQSSDQDYWTTTIGWGIAYGTWADYWKYGAGAFDCWGYSTDHPQGSGYIHAQGIQSGLHYANSNGTTAYGWQMVGAADAGSRWWLRGKWGGTTYSWYEIALFGRNVGGNLYADVFYDSNTAYYFDGSSTSDAGVKIAGGIHISAGNVTGNGIILADDGDIVDNNDGYCSMRFTYGVRIHSGNRTNTAKIDLKNDGSIVAAGNITAYGSPSDIRLKENLVKIENALQKVTSINGYHYNYIGKTDKLIGVIAQEVEPVLPEVVYEFSEVGSDPNTSKTKAVRYEHLTAVLIEAIKEQQKQIEQLSNELKSLKNKL